LDWESIGRSRKWLDYGLLCMYESSAMILVGAEDFELDTFTNTLTWPSFAIYSPISGKAISVAGGSTGIGDGDVIYIRNVEHPFKNESKTLTTGDPNSKDTRRPTNLFLGLRDGSGIYLFPSGGGTGVPPPRFKEEEHVYIVDCLDGAAPPTVVTTFATGNAKVQIRKFSSASPTNVLVPWEVPEDLDASARVRFRFMGLLSDAGMSGQGVVFGLKGYSIGDNDPVSLSWGSEVTVSASGSGSIGTRITSAFSNLVTIDNLAPGEMAMLNFERKAGHIGDTYGNDFAITGFKLQWTREAVS